MQTVLEETPWFADFDGKQWDEFRGRCSDGRAIVVLIEVEPAEIEERWTLTPEALETEKALRQLVRERGVL